MLADPPRGPAPDPLAADVVRLHAANRGEHGARKMKRALAREGKTASRRRVARIMKENGPSSAYSIRKFKPHAGKADPSGAPSVVARDFSGRAPRTHICSDLTHARVGGRWNYVCLLVDLPNREAVGHSRGPRKDAKLVMGAFSTVAFPLTGIEVFHTGRGSELDSMSIDAVSAAFGIGRSLPGRGNPYGNAVVESTDHILKREPVCRTAFADTGDLRVKLNDYVHWHNRIRMHSTLGYMSPVEFREKSLKILSE